MGVLHTVNKSSFSYSALASCIKICSANDSILLIEDGVYSSVEGAPYAQGLQQLIQQGTKVYALLNDLDARGLQDKMQRNIHIATYQDFVHLSIAHQCVQSWY